jgi:hypothetical protein
MIVWIAISIVLAAFACEFIDSSLGMGYGTILSPLLIIAGFDPLLVVPSLLLSQSIAGFSAAIFHHRFKNVDFHSKSEDSKVVYIITGCGILAAIIASLIAIQLPKSILKTYIGALVLIMGGILLSKANFAFSWKKISIIGMISAFNKGISGGGFGPVVTSGQLISGRDPKPAIGATTLAEAPICITAFLTYLLLKGMPDWRFVALLIVGAVAVTPIGPFITSKFKSEKLKIGLGGFVVALGGWMLIKTWFI